METHVNLFSEEYVFGCIGDVYGGGRLSIIEPSVLKYDISGPKSGGISIRFKTNSEKLRIQFSICDRMVGNYAHVGITAQTGISILYRKKEDWYCIDCVDARDNRGYIDINMGRFCDRGIEHEILIYGPILSYLSDINVEIAPQCYLKPISKERIKKVLFLGGKCTYGIGCTTTAMMFSNILGRKCQIETFNLSFNTPDYLQKCVAYGDEIISIMREMDFVFLEGDYVQQKEEVFKSEFTSFLGMMQEINCPIYIWNLREKRMKQVRDKIREWGIVKNNMYVVNTFETLIKNADEYMYSHNYINDSGNIRLYKIFKQLIY